MKKTMVLIIGIVLLLAVYADADPQNPSVRILRRIERKVDALMLEVREIKSALFPGKTIPNSPLNGEINVIPFDIALSWWFQPTNETPEIPSYDVYLDTVDATTLLGNSLSSFWPPDGQVLNLSPNTVYYWRVDARGTPGVTTGDVWTFTTGN